MRDIVLQSVKAEYLVWEICDFKEEFKEELNTFFGCIEITQNKMGKTRVQDEKIPMTDKDSKFFFSF